MLINGHESENKEARGKEKAKASKEKKEDTMMKHVLEGTNGFVYVVFVASESRVCVW